MPSSSDPAFRLTHALLNPDTAAAAAAALRGARGKAEVEGLSELILHPPSARAATAAILALEGCDEPLVLDALTAALTGPLVSVRIIAVQALHRRRTTHGAESLVRLLNTDESWQVRRVALRAVADHPGPERWRVLDAVNDPHWRVRHALIQVLSPWGETEAGRREIDDRLAGSAADARVQGVLEYLHYRWFGRPPVSQPADDPDGLGRTCPFWDQDPAVLACTLEGMSDAERRQNLDFMPDLLDHPDDRVCDKAVLTIFRWGEPRHIARTLNLLDEPRKSVGALAARQLNGLDMDRDRAEATAQFVLDQPDSSPAALAWARGRAASEGAFVAQGAGAPYALARDGDWTVRLRLAEQFARREDAEADPLLARLRSDYHPHVRAAALTRASAAELLQNPGRETSWHVLARATRLVRVPLWRFEPDKPWRPEPSPPPPGEDLRPNLPAPPHARVLGPAGLVVAPLGISGHYGLPVEGFVRAAEAGVNLLFWEPNYQSMTEFVTRLPAADRNAFHVVAGTFQANVKWVRHDAERALRLLKIDRLAVFLIFWVQSRARIAPDMRETLERLKDAGKVASFGLSTHARPLAAEALRTGWNPVMVRHSAAHRGAEVEVFPLAMERGASVLTFNNTCYGRLLKPRGDEPGAGAADCYRYTLAQPGVTACWSAPATLEQLEENLAALRDPELPSDRRERLRAHGDRVYEEDSTFRNLVRSR